MRKKYRAVSLIMTAAMFFSVMQIPQEVSAKKLEMKNCGVFKVMPVGSVFRLKVSGGSSGVRYSSGRDQVVSVSENGLLRAQKRGTANIKIQKGGRTAKIKIQVKPPTGYTISNQSGAYAGSVKTKVKAKKGYTVYFTTGRRFQQGNVIRSGKSKTFTFRKTKTLKLYALSASARMTTVNLNKTERFSQSRGDYLFKIVKKSNLSPSAEPMATAGPMVTAEPVVTAGPVASMLPQTTIVPSTGAAIERTAEPSSMPTASSVGVSPSAIIGTNIS